MPPKAAGSIRGQEKRKNSVKDKDAPKKRRLFVGTFLPSKDQESLAVLREFDERLSAQWGGRRLRWVRPEKMHVTWLFLGSVHEEIIPEIEEKLSAVLVEQRALELLYDKPALWPNLRQARHFVIEANMVPEEVIELHAKINKALGSYVEHPEQKRYRPHITVLRMDGGGIKTHDAFPEWFPLKERVPIKHQIQQIDLIESHLGGSKNYEAISTWMLCERHGAVP